MDFTLFSSLIFAGTIQGLIFSAIILSSKKFKTRSSLFLALMIVMFVLSSLQFVLEELDFYNYKILFHYIFLPWSFLMPPFLYWFVELYKNPKKTFSIKENLLYIPFAIMLFLTICYRVTVLSGNDDIFLYNGGRDYFVDFVDVYAEFLNILISIILEIYLIRRISKFQKETKNQIRRLQITWLKSILYVLLIATILWTFFTINMVVEEDEPYYYLLYLVVSFTIYFLGYAGIYKIGIEKERKAIRNARYSIAEAPSSKAKENTTEFKRLIESEKLFLDADLSLDTVAEKLNLSKSHLSRTINKELGESFSDYINKLRVTEAKQHLNNPEFYRYTILAIGLESGFNSKSTFNKSFKKFAGITPSQFQKSLQT